MKKRLKKSYRLPVMLICILCAAIVVSLIALFNHDNSDDDPENNNPAVTASVIGSNTPDTQKTAETTPETEKSPETTPEPVSVKKSYAPITPDNETGFQSTWMTWNTDADIYSYQTYNSAEISVYNPGSTIGSAALYRDGIPFLGGATYSVYFNVSSDISRTVRLQAVNNDTGGVVSSLDIAAGPESKFIEHHFTMSGSTYNGSLQFLIGNDGSGSVAASHTVKITEVRIISSYGTEDIRVNQVGYMTDQQKRCTFTINSGDLFDVVNAETNAIAYSGAILNLRENSDTWEWNSYGDFTNVMEPGTYYIRSQIGTVSLRFTISEDPYTELRGGLLKFLSLQRCGTATDASWAGDLAHAACHDSYGTLLYTEQGLDVSGGWHDAGDYGRYIKTAAKAVSDLLFAYIANPELFGDDNNGPDSGNGIPDILDEAGWELDWMLKMQDSSGNVYTKVITQTFAGDDCKPEDDRQPLTVMPTESTSTAYYGGTMAVAYTIYKDFNPEFAERCLQAAIKCNAVINETYGTQTFVNPTDYSGGNYQDKDDLDARFYLKMALYYATDDYEYLGGAGWLFADRDEKCATGVSWQQCGGYGRYLFLISENGKEKDSGLYSKLVASLKGEADTMLSITAGNSYETSIGSYTWGSNCFMTDNGIILSMAYDVTGEEKYRGAAIEQMNYVLGKNCMDYCYVSGFGTNYPKYMHCRLSVSEHAFLPGAVAGGADASLEDQVTKNMWDRAPAKVYVDDYNSYSTNEPTIYYNSSLLHLISRLS